MQSSTACIFVHIFDWDWFVFSLHGKLIGDFSYCGGRDRWSASDADDVNIVLSAVATDETVGDVGYRVPSRLWTLLMTSKRQNLTRVVSGWIWYIDDPELEGEEPSEVVVWKRRQKVERIQLLG